MKRKKIFKKWVVVLIETIMIIAVLVATADCESIKLFISKEIVSVLVLIVGFELLNKHINLFNGKWEKENEF